MALSISLTGSIIIKFGEEAGERIYKVEQSGDRFYVVGLTDGYNGYEGEGFKKLDAAIRYASELIQG